MSNRPFAFMALAFAGFAAGCAGGAAAPAEPTPALANEWRFSVDEHVALWYHGLALADAGPAGSAVPYYREGYVAEVEAARRRIGGSTPLTTTLGSRLENSGAIDGLQFMPLYFSSFEQMLQAVDVWNRAQGDPNRASDAQTQAVIAFLSQRFPNATQRAAVVDFVSALQQERSGFFARWWPQSQPSALAAESEALWRSLQPDMVAFLRYTDAGGGHATLIPALRGEGRSESGRGVAVTAIGGTSGEDARVIVGRVVHELAYTIGAEAVRDAVAPARIREIGEEVLVARAAVRAGAMVLERVAPELLDAYTADYIRAAGGDPARTTLVRQFPLPDELVQPLRDAVQLATAGI
ncbi:MAG TPA: hypothetical protein VF039_01660 [Longimicrobiales bacterium]